MVGTVALAVAGGLTLAARPDLWEGAVLLFLLALGLHHIVATYTRLVFDRESFRQHWMLVTILPVVVVGGVVASAFVIGFWTLPTAYFYWQSWHFARQSYGMERMYWRKAGGLGPDWATRAVIYAVPLWAILNRSFQRHFEYLRMEVRWLPVDQWMVLLAGGVALGSVAVWAFTRVALARREPAKLAHMGYLLTHVGIFAFSYAVLENPDHGWLAVSIWHSLQYLMIVWMYHNNRFKGGVDPKHRFLSALAQPRNLVVYLAICMALAAAIYFGIKASGDLIKYNGVALLLMLYPVVNFHHYIVDALIWKLRKKPVARQLGLE
ncbi:MAG: hypothetical protein IT462_12400 [Planctomycetes bacterium]|nr:hypothetical protein [Planctomycetota bacterium]